MQLYFGYNYGGIDHGATITDDTGKSSFYVSKHCLAQPDTVETR